MTVLLEKACHFVTQPSCTDTTYNYIKEVLEDPNFQENPQYFTKIWRNIRGSDDISFPEDDRVLRFLEEQFKE